MSEFTYTIGPEHLSRGLRPSKRVPRNSNYLIKSDGAIGRGGALVVLDELTRIDTSGISDPFPYPQIFTFHNAVIVCGDTKIYEYDGSTLVFKIEATRAADMWTAVEFHGFIYMSNNDEVIIRDPLDKSYYIQGSDPRQITNGIVTAAICNYNGQIIVRGK